MSVHSRDVDEQADCIGGNTSPYDLRPRVYVAIRGRKLLGHVESKSVRAYDYVIMQNV
jgi:hypothetical protein